MKEFKGTPGPWTVSQYNTYVYAGESNLVVCDSHTENQEVPESLEERQRNAILIASAPELLTALQNLVHLHMCEQEGLSSGQPSPIDWLKAVDQASEAITKAIG